jgi:hypothetical protein
MARQRPHRSLARETRHFTRSLASEYRTSEDLTWRILRRLINYLRLSSTSVRGLGPRDCFAYAFGVLNHAYDALGPMRARRLIPKAVLRALEGRMAAADYFIEGCRDDGLPLYSLQELASKLVGFRRFLHEEREHLLSTGLPARFYRPCRWLWHRTANLYVTRRTGNCLPFDEPDSADGDLRYYEWVRSRTDETGAEPGAAGIYVTKLEPCPFDAADLVARFAVADEKNLIQLRGRLLDVKLAVLGRVAACIRRGAASDLLPICMEVIFGSLTPAEVAFCLRCDVIYSHVLKKYRQTDSYLKSLLGIPNPTPPGGITSILEIVGHAEKELTIGSMWRTRKALGKLVVTRDSDSVLRVPDDVGNYFGLIAFGSRQAVDKALDGFVDCDDLERDVWSDYRKRVRSALKQKSDKKPAFESLDQESFREKMQQIIEALDFPMNSGRSMKSVSCS